MMIGRKRARAAAVLALLTAGTMIGVPATANEELPEGRWATIEDLGLPVPNESEKQQAIRVYSHHEPVVYSSEGTISSVESVEDEGSQKVITLSADVLFKPDEWDLPASAPKRLESLLEEIPEGAEITVEGHTDSVVGVVDNQELSDNRARAVADVISELRPDLESQVAGYADTRPKKKESESDDEARRLNRRVEIRYEN